MRRLYLAIWFALPVFQRAHAAETPASRPNTLYTLAVLFPRRLFSTGLPE